MAVVMHHTQQNSDALVTDDNRVKGMGPSANEIFEHLSRSTREYYGLSEALPQYPSNSFPIIDRSTFERYVRRNLRDTFDGIEELRTWNNGWNGYDAPKPKYTNIVNARLWITDLFQAVANLGWIKPNVTGGPEGGVVFEWWYGKRKLTVYVEEQSIEYVQVWGTAINADITSGDIESTLDNRELWMWLIGLK